MKNKAKRNFLKLNWKSFLILVVAWFLAVLLHNVVFALTGIEEAFFFILAIFVIPIYFIVSLVYTIYRKVRRK